MSECLDVVRNEWIKLLRRKRFLIVLLLGLGIAAFFLAVEYRHARQLSLYNSPEYQRQQLERWIQDTERALAEDKKLAGAERQSMEESLTARKKELEELANASNEPAAFNEEKAKSRVAQLKESLASLPPEQKNSHGSLELELKKAYYLLENRVAVNDTRFGEGMTMWRAMKDFMEIGPILFIPMLCVLLVSDIISGEMTSGTVKLLLIRPVSRGGFTWANSSPP
ncbi:ABC transporter permease subunit [Paenibacillus sp. CC-CFT747]|nr:ABC transporter permease subunit [Paenibacillus sp. CC-CFT747]